MREAAGDFGGSQVVTLPWSGKRWWGGLIRKDLRVRIGALLPVDIFPNEPPYAPGFSGPQGYGLELGIDLPKLFRVRITSGHRHPNFPHRDANQRPDLEQLQPHRRALRLGHLGSL